MIEATSENAFRAGTSTTQRPASGKLAYRRLAARILSEWPTIRESSAFGPRCTLREDLLADYLLRGLFGTKKGVGVSVLR
jgi:hypothetical protein